jgi:hypothetical protein
MTRDELVCGVEKRIGMFLMAVDGESKVAWHSLLADAKLGAEVWAGVYFIALRREAEYIKNETVVSDYVADLLIAIADALETEKGETCTQGNK